MANAKVTLNGVTLIDLTSDTVTANDILYGKVAHGSDGSSITGTISTVTHPNPSVSINTGTGVITASHTQSSGLVTGGTTSSTLNLSTVSEQTINPTESTQTAVASQKYTLGAVKIGAISSNYIGSNIAQRSAVDLSASGSKIIVPSGYYAAEASKAIPAGSATTPATTIMANPVITIDRFGSIFASTSASQSITPTVVGGYVSQGTAGTVTVSGSSSFNLSTQAGTTVSPTESEQTAVNAGKYTLGAIKVGAISSNYVGSNVPTHTSTDLTASGSYINVPSGYYAAAASKNVGAGSATTPATTITANPTLTINPSTGIITGAVDKSQNITPSVTAGYVQNGTAGTVTISGSSSLALSTQAGATINPTESEQTAVASYKYTLGAIKVAAIPSKYKDTTGADAVASQVLSGKKFVNSTGLVTGTMTDRGAVSTSLNTTTTSYTIPSGYHNGSGTVSITTETKSATPSTLSQTITPTTGKVLSGVTVAAIPSQYIITTDATATASDILYNKTAYVNGSKVTGIFELARVSNEVLILNNTGSSVSGTVLSI